MKKVITYFKENTMRSDKYLDFIRAQPCLVCGMDAVAHHEPLSGHGVGLKGPDNETLPLCPFCHHERHFKGRDTFWKKYNIAWRWCIRKYQNMFNCQI